MYTLSVITSLLLGAVAFLICSWFLSRPKNLPPGPWSIPIIGYRFGPGLLHDHLTELARKYGPIFSLRRGPFLFVVLNDKASFKEALVKKAESFSDRYVPGHMAWGIPNTNKNATLVWSNGQPWINQRRFSLPALRSFGFGKKSLEPQINLEARYLCEEIEKHRGAPCSLTHTTNKATANVISQLVFGRRFEYDDDDFDQVLRSLFDIFVTISDSDPVIIFPILMQTPWYKHYRDIFIHNQEFIDCQLNAHKESFQLDNIRDFTDAFIADDISKEFTLVEFWRIALDLFAAGTDTTSTSISWAIIYMAVYPDVQRKVQTELDTIVGRGRQPSTNDRPSLPYCDATLMEIMRIRPVLPTALPHMTSCDTSAGGFTIPKGTIVIPNIWAVHHDPAEWCDPDAFDPERFLQDDGRTIKKSDAWMPFGVGRRDCLGVQLAKMETFLLFANLTQRFEFKLPSDQSTHSLRGTPGLTMSPEPYRICAIER